MCFGRFFKNILPQRSKKKGIFQTVTALPFLILSSVHQLLFAKADTLFATEIETNTTYRIDYNPSDFPKLNETLRHYCNVTVQAISDLSFNATSSPYCIFDKSETGPGISLSVEFLKYLTESFKSCLNQAMLLMCKEYEDGRGNDRAAKFGTGAIIVVSILAGVSLVGGICMLRYSKCGSTNRENNTSQSDSTDNDTSTTVYTSPISDDSSSSHTVSVGWS